MSLRTLRTRTTAAKLASIHQRMAGVSEEDAIAGIADPAKHPSEGNPMTTSGTDEPQIMTVKQEILRAVAALPDDAGYDEAFEALHVLYKIHVGVQQGEAGLDVPQAEIARRMAKWLS